MNWQNNKFHTDLKWTYEAYKFVMCVYKMNMEYSQAFKNK
jgi:hypothetical protein